MKHHIDTRKPPKHIDFSDDCCPHKEPEEERVLVRLFCNGVKYDNKCYSVCTCGKLVIPVAKRHAHQWINAGMAEWVKEGTEATPVGHTCCDDHKGDDMPDTPAIVLPVVEKPNVVRPAIDPVLKPAAPVVQTLGHNTNVQKPGQQLNK